MFCLQFDCLQALFRTIKNFKNEDTFAHTTLLHTNRIAHMILLPTILRTNKKFKNGGTHIIAYKSHCAHDPLYMS